MICVGNQKDVWFALEQDPKPLIYLCLRYTVCLDCILDCTSMWWIIVHATLNITCGFTEIHSHVFYTWDRLCRITVQSLQKYSFESFYIWIWNLNYKTQIQQVCRLAPLWFKVKWNFFLMKLQWGSYRRLVLPHYTALFAKFTRLEKTFIWTSLLYFPATCYLIWHLKHQLRWQKKICSYRLPGLSRRFRESMFSVEPWV